MRERNLRLQGILATELGRRALTHTLSLCSWLLGYSEQGGPRPGFKGSLCTVRASVSLHLNLTCKPTALPERPDQTCPWGRDFGAIWHPAREKQMFCCFPTSPRISPSPLATPSWPCEAARTGRPAPGAAGHFSSRPQAERHLLRNFWVVLISITL